MRLIRRWEEQMALPSWKWYILKILLFLSRKENRRKIYWGIFDVLSAFLAIIMFYLAFIIFGQDELHRECTNNHIQQDTTYYKAYTPANKIGGTRNVYED